MGVMVDKYFEIPDSSWSNLGMVIPRQLIYIYIYQKRAHREIYLLSYIRIKFIEQSKQNLWSAKVVSQVFKSLFLENAYTPPLTRHGYIKATYFSIKREHTENSTFLATNKIHTVKCVEFVELQSCNHKRFAVPKKCLHHL